MKAWTQSYSGKLVTPLDLKPEQVSFADIAYTLSQKIRFNGHLKVKGYSVAQHCVVGASLIDPWFSLAFLLHEVSEVYLPDIPSPIKPSIFVHPNLPGGFSWSDLEARHATAIFEALDLSSIRPVIDSSKIKEMDLRMLATEKRDLMGPEPEPWNLGVEPLEYKIQSVWPPDEAERGFNELFRLLTSVKK